MADESKNIRKYLKEYVSDRVLAPTSTLQTLLSVNKVKDATKLSRSEVEGYTHQIIDLINYNTFLPQSVPLTATFVGEIFDPATSVEIDTGSYRVTMRKLLKLSLTQLQQQAELMKIDASADLDQEGIAALILINMNEDTDLIFPLKKLLLSKEIAQLFGIKFEMANRGPKYPSSTVSFVVKPQDIVRSTLLSRTDVLRECQNQSIPVNPKETKSQLAIHLIVWLTMHPDQIRQPFTPNFLEFILEKSTYVSPYRY